VNHNIRTLFLLCFSVLSLSSLSGQEWIKERSVKKNDSIFAIYSWRIDLKVHSGYGKIILKKGGRFFYSSELLGAKDYSEGRYRIKENLLTLTSDLQFDNIKFEIKYIDTTIIDSSYSRLTFPQNLKGETMYCGYYYLNWDTSWNGLYLPGFLRDPRKLDSLKSIKVGFDPNNFGTKFVTVEKSNRFIKVVILTEKNFDNYSPLVFSNWRFRILKNKLIEISKKKKYGT
jgi:hypothetical protein